MPKIYSVEIPGGTVDLRADRSLWWPERSILFIADVHAGKVEHFQKYGQAIPSGSLAADLNRLDNAISELQPKRLIVLGDLFHSEINSEWLQLSSWIKQQSCGVELIRGNHDRFISDEVCIAAGLIVHEEGLKLGPFTLRHHPLETSTEFILCGHLHPVHMFHGPGSDRLRLPTFVVQEHQIILPAFGSFTGGLHMTRLAGLLVGTAPDFQSLIVGNLKT